MDCLVQREPLVGRQNTGSSAPFNSDLLAALGFSEESLAWEVSRLSSGNVKRLALFRMLIGKPKLLLLDEPTANLDQ